MTAEEICTKVNGTLAVSAEDAAATGVYVGDLLSDIMGHAPDMAEAAAREGVAIIITPLSQYATARALNDLPPSEH